MENQLISAFLLENNQVEVNYVSDDIRSVSYTFSRDGEVFRLKKISETGTNSIYKVVFQTLNRNKLQYQSWPRTSYLKHNK